MSISSASLKKQLNGQYVLSIISQCPVAPKAEGFVGVMEYIPLNPATKLG